MAFKVTDECVIMKGEVANRVCIHGGPVISSVLQLHTSQRTYRLGKDGSCTVFFGRSINYITLRVCEPCKMASILFAVKSFVVFPKFTVI